MKLGKSALVLLMSMSPPVWGRGLKLGLSLGFLLSLVAPRVGAWIETAVSLVSAVWILVAPRVGAWIETAPAFGGADPG